MLSQFLYVTLFSINGRFINDVINFKCDDGVKREAIIIKDSDNGKFDVAYMTSEGCKNVKIKVERDVTENKFHGVSNGKSSILPYSTGDLVAFYVKPEVYYLAHIIEIGSYNTVKIILGDLYMDGWVKDDKKGDILEVNVSDIRWDGSACDFNKKTKIRYGYEPKELRNPNWKKNLLRGIRNVTLTVLMCLLAAYSFPKLINFLNTYEANYNSSSSNSNISTAPITTPQNDFERPTQEDLESYSPLQRVLAELYNKKLEDITQEEIAAISYLSLSEYQGYDSNFSYSARCNIGTGATMLFNMPNLKSLSLDTCQLRMNPDSISDNSALSSLSIKSIEILDNYTSETDGFFTYVDYDVIELSEHMDFFNHFKNLKELTVNGQKINDVNAFCNITTLETLDLTDNNITDFSPLASLSNLKSLTIKNNSFTVDPSNINLGNDVEIIQ